jgi:DNA-binding SARP family transcriptional activator
VRLVLVRVLVASQPSAHADEADLRPMERKLVAALAIRRPAAVSVTSLTDALWGDDPPTSAKKTIQTNVLRLRDKLGRDAVETVGDGYRLGADVEVDIERFERAVRDALKESGASTARWDGALEWCGGEPLDDFDHWRPADGRRAQLDELRSVAIEARWEAALEEGSASDLLPDLEAFVAEDPLRERRWALLLAAYQRAGRTADGLRAFERGRRTLAEELGVSPGPELVAAYESLLREESGSAGLPRAERPRSFGPCRSRIG